MAELEPISLETTSGIIADRLRKAIGDGVFPPGRQLGEAQLAKQLQVSRGPVREALQRLVQEGLLRNERHRGVFVITLDEADVADVYLAREAVERAAAKLVIRRGTVPDVLEEVVKDMAASVEEQDWEQVVTLDLRFHEALVEASGSRRLNRIFRTLLVETKMCIRALEPAYANRRDIVAEHRRLLDALAESDEGAALRLVESHMEDALSDLRG